MPNKKNPFGKGEIALKFSEFDIFKKVRGARVPFCLAHHSDADNKNSFALYGR